MFPCCSPFVPTGVFGTMQWDYAETHVASTRPSYWLPKAPFRRVAAAMGGTSSGHRLCPLPPILLIAHILKAQVRPECPFFGEMWWHLVSHRSCLASCLRKYCCKGPAYFPFLHRKCKQETSDFSPFPPVFHLFPISETAFQCHSVSGRFWDGLCTNCNQFPASCHRLPPNHCQLPTNGPLSIIPVPVLGTHCK